MSGQTRMMLPDAQEVVCKEIFRGALPLSLDEWYEDSMGQDCVLRNFSRSPGMVKAALVCKSWNAAYKDYVNMFFAEEARKLTGGKGVDVVLDMVAGSYVAREVDCLAEEGRLVIIAVQGGVKAEFNAGLVLRRRLQITGSTLRPRPVDFKAAIAAALRERVWPLLASGAIRPVIYGTFAAAEAAQAHELMESNRHIGKIVLTW